MDDGKPKTNQKKTFFSLVDVVNVYGDKNFLSGVHTQKKNIKKITKKK
jgi:hypothetical protein